MTETLLPPNARPLERGLEAAAARVSGVPIPLPDLWNPAMCAADLLPWLAWGLSIDTWDSAWSEARKREETARAIEIQRRKGTPATIDAVLGRFDPLLELVEWFEAEPRLDPHRFQVTLPLLAGGGDRSTAAFAERLVREISRVKPLRSHLEFIQSITAAAGLSVVGAGRTAGFARLDLAAVVEEGSFLTTEDGEPLQAESGDLLEL
ncbi:MAG: phage tail protein I [Alphaproteobacteria bacterium]|nr:MAG: phage tail protein I [Alphaproteobacteria bacterium]